MSCTKIFVFNYNHIMNMSKSIVFRTEKNELECFVTNDNNVFLSIGSMGVPAESIELDVDDVSDLIETLQEFLNQINESTN